MSIVTQNFSRNKYFNWAVKNLFSSWVNTIMTIIAITTMITIITNNYQYGQISPDRETDSERAGT